MRRNVIHAAVTELPPLEPVSPLAALLKQDAVAACLLLISAALAGVLANSSAASGQILLNTDCRCHLHFEYFAHRQ